MDNVKMKNVDTQFLKLPEYRRDTASSTVDIREHAVAHPICDLVTPKVDDDAISLNSIETASKNLLF